MTKDPYNAILMGLPGLHGTFILELIVGIERKKTWNTKIHSSSLERSSLIKFETKVSRVVLLLVVKSRKC